jgi:hypothetical protein
MYLRQSTASQVVPLGPFLDVTDGDTEETALTIANTDIKISKNGATAVDKTAGGATHDQGGIYLATLDATDTDTLGNIEINVHVAGALYAQKRLTVLPAKIYDSIIAGSDNLEVDVIEMLGVAGTSLPSTQASVDGLNDISTAEVRTEVDGGIAAAGLSTFDYTTDQVIVGTNNDKTGYSISGTVDVTAINGSTDAARKLAISANSIGEGAAVAGTLSTTQMSTDLVEVTDNHYVGRAVMFTSGSLSGQVKGITGYTGATKVLTFGALTEAPVAGTEFILL